MNPRASTVFIILLIAVLLPSCVPIQQPQLTIRVIAPSSTPKDARLIVVGSDSLWGNWDPFDGIRLVKESDSVWTVTRRVPRDFTLEFKVTRGPWSTEAIYQRGIRPQNISVVVQSDTVITLRPIGWMDRRTTEAIRSKSEAGGTIRYHHAMESDKLKYARDVVVWLPPSYFRQTDRRYPVLYMHDGQNTVGAEFETDWRADEVADSLIRAHSIEEIIIVGIYNSPDRNEEYANTEKGRTYADFVVNTVKPFIDAKYRTQSDRAHTAVMGSSMGGLISFLFVWWHPDIFSQAGCLSSAFLDDVSDILDQVRNYGGPKKRIRIYMDISSQGIDQRLKQSTDEMFSLLQEKGYTAGKDVEYYYDRGADHTERAWAARLWRPLLFMFGTKNTQ